VRDSLIYETGKKPMIDSSLLEQAKQALHSHANPEDALFLQRFFKTGPGEYAEGDIFIGVRVPVTRKIARQFKDLPLDLTSRLLCSSVHEERLLALVILTERMKKKGPAEEKREIYELYLSHTEWINNWDLVDVTAEHVVGRYLYDKTRQPLYNLGASKDLWERRISIISTFYFIRKGDFDDTLRLAELHLEDSHDLMHKAVGWMLREVGKRDQPAEEDFLRKHYRVMPRTMLRYAIERFPEELRQGYLKGRI
jgi:3-methyladenine DNA glycosylase AlkD